MDEKEVCKNCKREIPSVNYVMHLAHCLRNTEICSECGEPVLIAQREQHHRENHQKVKCRLCGQEIVPAKLNIHMENSCLEKLVECSICGIEIPVRKLNDHELYCGSRTELCEKCNKYVMIKDLEKHVCVVSSPLQENVTIPCEFCEAQVELFELERHQTVCPQAPYENDEDDVEILDDLTANTPHGRPDSSQQDNERNNGEETTDGIGEAYSSIYALPCEFCKELCPSDKLHEHQLQCEENPETIDVVDDHDDNDDTRHVDALPCEFCNDLYPMDKLNEHQLQCHKNPETVVVDDDDDETSDEPRSSDRWDPFQMMYHPFMFGSVFDAMMTHNRDPRLFRRALHDPWVMINIARR